MAASCFRDVVGHKIRRGDSTRDWTCSAVLRSPGPQVRIMVAPVSLTRRSATRAYDSGNHLLKTVLSLVPGLSATMGYRDMRSCCLKKSSMYSRSLVGIDNLKMASLVSRPIPSRSLLFRSKRLIALWGKVTRQLLKR